MGVFGFFSWECAVCGKSIRAFMQSEESAWFNECVVKRADGVLKRGRYDGYGGVYVYNSNEVYEILEHEKEPKVYHAYCFDKWGDRPEFDHPSKEAEDQGFFSHPHNYCVSPEESTKHIRLHSLD